MRSKEQKEAFGDHAVLKYKKSLRGSDSFEINDY